MTSSATEEEDEATAEDGNDDGDRFVVRLLKGTTIWPLEKTLSRAGQGREDIEARYSY